MRLAAGESGNIDAWITTRRSPVGWRERADFDWWAAWSRANPDPVILGGTPVVRAGPPEERAAGMVDRMAYQFGYPADAVLAGIPVAVILGVLRRLIGRVITAPSDQPMRLCEAMLMADLATAVSVPTNVIARTLASFTLETAGVAWHAAVPGIATAPLVRLDREHVFLCRAGLTSEPLLFLTRELRRRDATAITASAHLHEDVFRRDLYGLFADRRFVTSTSRIQLRHAGGDLRTDIDAAIFDRKTGALGLFELKSQDPFARSLAERTRQRDNLLYAGRQVSAILDWINRHGADEILNRIDRETAKRFRVQKVFPFVLGRYLARFDDGPTPNRRIAWGTWPHLLRLRGGQPVSSNEPRPLAAIHARLAQDMTTITIPPGTPPQEVHLGATRLTVYPSLNALRRYHESTDD